MRSAVRLAAAVSVANAVLLAVVGSTTAAVLGSFAVVILLYFLDFTGSARERVTGYVAATVVGLVAVTLGTVLAQPQWLAVVGAFAISSVFAFARVLRGYVAHAAVGLQGAFFLPLMAPATTAELPTLLGGWLIGSAIAVVAALVLPNEEASATRRLLAAWLRSASELTATLADAPSADGEAIRRARTDVQRAHEAIVADLACATRPGAVSRRQRALSAMVARARWSMPIASALAPDGDGPGTTPIPQAGPLAAASATAFAQAAVIVDGSTLPSATVDIAAARRSDMDAIVGLPAATVTAHYPVRVVSIAAQMQLWLAGASRGHILPTPDIGSVTAESPSSLARIAASARSIWLHNALRTGLAAALCVWLVRDLGLSHGLWVVFVALTCLQATFSATGALRTLIAVCAGAVGGVLAAGLLLSLHLPHVVFVVLLPLAAFAARMTSQSGPLLAQLAYTPFALVNVAVLSWPTAPGLADVRLQDVALGALVAVVVSVVVFPFGLRRIVGARQAAAAAASIAYLDAAIAAAHGGDAVDPRMRERSVTALADLDHVVDTAYMQPSAADGDIAVHEQASALAHDRVIGGDVCLDVARQRAADPRAASVADGTADWWARYAQAAVPSR